MIKLYDDKKYCCGCMACVDACPQNAVLIETDSEGFNYPRIKADLCVNCEKCLSVCPFKIKKYKISPKKYIAARAKDNELRKISTSGAVFPVLGNEILSRNGTVYGAAFDEKMTVIHKRAENARELEPLMQTKYVQSETAGIYRRVKRDLSEGREVLFAGTPCQTHALRLFLGDAFPKLITLDTVCFGVSSPGVWTRYKEYLEKKYKGSLTKFNFRDKRRYNNGHTVSFCVGDTEHTEKDYGSNLFLSLYFGGYTLRPSCYACEFCSPDRSSDITVGDFWGIEKVAPKMNDGMGVSLVMLRTKNAEILWENVMDKFSNTKIQSGDATQPRLVSPTPSPSGRGLFWSLNRILPFGAFALKGKIGKILHGKK